MLKHDSLRREGPKKYFRRERQPGIILKDWACAWRRGIGAFYLLLHVLISRQACQSHGQHPLSAVIGTVILRQGSASGMIIVMVMIRSPSFLAGLPPSLWQQ